MKDVPSSIAGGALLHYGIVVRLGKKDWGCRNLRRFVK